jgi:hypothetical protein
VNKYKILEIIFEFNHLRQRLLNEWRIGSIYKNQTRIHYKKTPNILSGLCDKYGSDKGSNGVASETYPWKPHNYSDHYERLFGHRKERVKSVFECGIGTNNVNLPSNMTSTGKPGASLRVWRDYFVNATIYGADIDTEILFQDSRIKTYYVNQLDVESIQNLWSLINHQDFDVMIDDGLHTFEAGLTLFENSINKLGHEGIYIIEDVGPLDLLKFCRYFDNTNFEVEIVTFKSPQRKFGETSLISIQKPSSNLSNLPVKPSS